MIHIKNEHSKAAPAGAPPAQADQSLPIYDRVFKRVFSLSNQAIVHFVNGFFLTDFPPDSNIFFPNHEYVRGDLTGRSADTTFFIGGRAFHFEAQMRSDNSIALRVLEYDFQHALSTSGDRHSLLFPDSAVLYLASQGGVPETDSVRLRFGSQGAFEYRIRNFPCLSCSAEELTRRKMGILLPFQILRLRALFKRQQRQARQGRPYDRGALTRLQDEIRNDIIVHIRRNYDANAITYDDAQQLWEMTLRLHQHICADITEKTGGLIMMKPLLPGAIELPNDKYRFRIAELEEKVSQFTELEQKVSQYADENRRYANENKKYADENKKYADENRRYANENKKYADENRRYANENKKYADENKKYADENRKYASDLLRYISENEELKKRIAELEARQSTQ